MAGKGMKKTREGKSTGVAKVLLLPTFPPRNQWRFLRLLLHTHAHTPSLLSLNQINYAGFESPSPASGTEDDGMLREHRNSWFKSHLPKQPRVPSSIYIYVYIYNFDLLEVEREVYIYDKR